MKTIGLKWLAALALLLLLAGCGGKRITVEIPPQIDLRSLGTIGVVAFDVHSDSRMPEDVTLRFIQYMQAAQPGVPVLELGSEARLLQAVGARSLDADTVRAIGQRYGVDTLLTGTLEVETTSPDVRFGQNLTSLSASSYVRGNLDARLRQTRSGATIWSNGAHGKWKLTDVSISASALPSIGVNNVEDKYKKMLQELARVGTADFRSTYETREVEE